MTHYEMRSMELSCYADFLIPTEKEKVRGFINGLHFGIRIGTTHGANTQTTFHQVVEIARRLECIHMQGKEECDANKDRNNGGYSGSSS